MRVGFIAASVVAHLGVVGLAFQAARVTSRTSAVQVARPSGLFSVELTQPADAVAPSVERASDGENTPASEAAEPSPPHEQSANVARRVIEPLVRAEPAMPKPAATPARAPLVEKVKPNFEEAAQDWLSIDQQLPEPEVQQAQPGASPPRDELVERLLAKEREKQRVKQREELARAATSVESVADNGQLRRAVTSPDDSVAGTSHDSADPWVELTRWLPRAASSDQTWETLPSDTRLDVKVLVRTAPNRPVEVKAAGEVPAVVARLLSTAAHMMQRGKFVGTERTERRFALRIRLSQTAERELWIAHTTPDPPKPGVGSFVSTTGRRFDVWVAAEP